MSGAASRRAVLAAVTAAASLRATPTLAADGGRPDPVFALLDADRMAWNALGDACDMSDTAATEAEEAAADAAQSEASEASFMAQSAVFAATPTTAGGLLAMVALFEERSEHWLPQPFDADCRNLLAAVRHFVEAGR